MLEEMMPRWVPTENVNGFEICPGLYRDEGATAFQSAVNFTVHSKGAVTCELLLFHRKEQDPYAVIPFPENCRIGDVFSMMVFGLDIEEFEYAYRLDGPWKPKEGLLFKNRYQLQVSSFKTGSILVHSFFFFSHRLRPVDNQDSDRNQHQCDQVFHSKYISLTQNDRGKDHPEYRIRKSEDRYLGYRIVFQQDSPQRVCNCRNQRHIDQKNHCRHTCRMDSSTHHESDQDHHESACSKLISA